jgi:uncharacterized protein YjbJ (UPF0337 family)
MNADVFKGEWHQLKGEAKTRWGKLTADDLDRVEGDTEKLIGGVQERYGYARAEAQSIVPPGQRSADGRQPTKESWIALVSRWPRADDRRLPAEHPQPLREARGQGRFAWRPAPPTWIP